MALPGPYWRCPGCQQPRSWLTLPADHVNYCVGIKHSPEAEADALPTFVTAYDAICPENFGPEEPDQQETT